jgi:hypothetical protein
MDIVKRLRKWMPEENTYELLSDAADEIERLREENKKLQLNSKPKEHLSYDDGFGGYPSVYNKR